MVKKIMAFVVAGAAVLAAVILPLDIARSRPELLGESEAGADSRTSAALSPGPDSSDGEPALPSETSGLAEIISLVPEGDSTESSSREKSGSQTPSRAASTTPPAASQSGSPQRPSFQGPQTQQPSLSSSQAMSSGAGSPTASLPSPSRPAANSSPNGTGTLSYPEQVVRLVNKEREKAGLQPLAISQPAEAAALVRAKETEQSFSHTRPDGRQFSTALLEQGARFRTAGENIAWGQRTPEQVMQGWMNSSGHRANILNASYTAIGVGYYRNAAGTNYWTQLFTG
ncbi:CAP domain-containing protein [Hydrogeniiclostridium mannosilyticum]|nr:CAP domain-containing protein [Hydrogeniiclostridium mannosilyticum]